MQPGVKELIDKRCRRSIASVLGVKEREVDRYLPEETQRMLRKVLIDAFNDLANVCLDVFESFEPTAGTVVVNEMWLERLDAIFAAVVE